MTLPPTQAEPTVSPRLVETFHVSVRKGIAVILSQSTIPRGSRDPLFQLGAWYSPLVLLVSLDDTENHEIYSYDFKATLPGFETSRVLEEVSRFEQGWHVTEEGMLLSPQPSSINQASLLNVLVKERETLEPLAS